MNNFFYTVISEESSKMFNPLAGSDLFVFQLLNAIGCSLTNLILMYRNFARKPHYGVGLCKGCFFFFFKIS